MYERIFAQRIKFKRNIITIHNYYALWRGRHFVGARGVKRCVWSNLLVINFVRRRSIIKYYNNIRLNIWIIIHATGINWPFPSFTHGWLGPRISLICVVQELGFETDRPIVYKTTTIASSGGSKQESERKRVRESRRRCTGAYREYVSKTMWQSSKRGRVKYIQDDPSKRTTHSVFRMVLPVFKYIFFFDNLKYNKPL